MASDGVKAVGDVAQFKNSLRKPVTAADRKPGPYPYYGAATIQDWVDGYLFEGLHVLVGEDGTVQTSDGRPLIQLVDGKFWVNNHAHVLTCESAADTRFLAYALNQVQVAPFVTGAAQPKLNMGNLRRVNISWPDVEVRKEIAKLGEYLDDRIANLRQSNTTLEAIAQALFKSWFVNFDPVRAKAEDREPEGMDAATAALFPSEFEDSECRTRPMGWRIVEASTMFDVGIGKTPPRKEAHWFSTEQTDVPWVSIRDMGRPGAFVGKTSEYLTEEAVIRFNVRRVPAGTVLLSFKLTVGRIVIAESELTTNEAIAHFRTNGKSLPQSYLYCYLKSFDMSSLGSTSSIATATNSRAIRALPILHPGDRLAARFDQYASPLLELVRAQQRQIESLTELRNTLLPRLISGKLRLPEAEREAEDALA